MKEVKVLVTLQVDPDAVGDNQYTDDQLEATGLEAVKNALDHFHANGFLHALANDVSVDIADVELVQ